MNTVSVSRVTTGPVGGCDSKVTSANRTPSTLMVPLLPGGFGAAEASCATATPAVTTMATTISQIAFRVLRRSYRDIGLHPLGQRATCRVGRRLWTSEAALPASRLARRERSDTQRASGRSVGGW